MVYTINSVEILGSGNLRITYTLDGNQNTVEVDKMKMCNITCGRPLRP